MLLRLLDCIAIVALWVVGVGYLVCTGAPAICALWARFCGTLFYFPSTFMSGCLVLVSVSGLICMIALIPRILTDNW